MWPNTHPSRSDRRQFCIDACLSYRVAESVDDLSHVSLLPELQEYVIAPGQCSARDREIVEVCAEIQLVIVICDDGLRRLTRGEALVDKGAEVILFTYELTGLKTHIRTVTRLLPRWQQRLSHPFAGNLWLQRRRGGLQRA